MTSEMLQIPASFGSRPVGVQDWEALDAAACQGFAAAAPFLELLCRQSLVLRVHDVEPAEPEGLPVEGVRNESLPLTWSWSEFSAATDLPGAEEAGALVARVVERKFLDALTQHPGIVTQEGRPLEQGLRQAVSALAERKCWGPFVLLRSPVSVEGHPTPSRDVLASLKITDVLTTDDLEAGRDVLVWLAPCTVRAVLGPDPTVVRHPDRADVLRVITMRDLQVRGDFDGRVCVALLAS